MLSSFFSHVASFTVLQFVAMYGIATFFVNHFVAQVVSARAFERPARPHGFLLEALKFFAVILRMPFYLIGIIAYNLACIGTLLAYAATKTPELVSTLWIFVLAENLGRISFAVLSGLQKQFKFLFRYARTKWALPHHDFYRGDGKLFVIEVEASREVEATLCSLGNFSNLKARLAQRRGLRPYPLSGT